MGQASSFLTYSTHPTLINTVVSLFR